MTQPKFAPIPIEDEVRPLHRLGPAAPWRPSRPGELVTSRPGRAPEAAPGRGRGSPGPDQGYALRLAERFAARLVLGPGERAEDVMAGAVALAMRRAALFGRAPVAVDLEVALALFDYLGPAEPAVQAVRRASFAGLGHDEWRRRELANGVAEASLRLNPEEAAAQRVDPVSPPAATAPPRPGPVS